MSVLVFDPGTVRRIRNRRIHPDMTRWDEMWEGVRVVPPIPNNEHQEIQFNLALPFHETVTAPNLGYASGGVNVSDRNKGWRKNYRIPDLVVYLNGTTAIDRDTHWTGGPDFLVEIVSDGENPYAKFEFYAKVNTREVLLVLRDPWAVELHRLRDGKLERIGRVNPDDGKELNSTILPLTFGLIGFVKRPRVSVRNTETGKTWSA